MPSIRTLIADALMVAINAVTELKYKNFDIVKLTAADFQEWELPAVQLIDVVDINVHELGRGRREWNITLELIIGPTGTTQPTQRDLWDLLEKLEQAIMVKPNLGLKQVIHAEIVNTSTDLHVLNPFYLGKLDFAVKYYQPLVNDC